ncbi:unnamed protein product [Ectocarpus sp. 12 AP-2014]
MAGAGTESFVRRHQMLSLSFWVTLLFSILFAMAAMDVTGQCYVDPCSTISPAVTSGMSLVTAIAAFLFIAQPCYGLYLLRIQCSELVSGIFIGCSTFTTLGALAQGVQWGSETNLATAIADEADTDVNSSGVMSFKALAILAWILFAMQLFTTYWCCKARDVLLEVSWSAGHDYTQLPTRAGLHGNGNKFSSYQQAMDDEDLEAAANGDPGASLAHYL